MSFPAAEPKRLLVIERVIVVLKAMRQGEGYWYTAAEVVKQVVHEREVLKFPFYMVEYESSPGPPKSMINHGFTEDLSIIIKGACDGEAGDTTTKLERCIRDVRTAIDADASSGVAGSLGALGVIVSIDSLEIEHDASYGYFNQRFVAHIRGDWRSL
jgi:hypothetical protein